jgi:hypothetical protein
MKLVRIANAAHTGLDIVRRQDFRVFGAGILDAAIRMMDQSASFGRLAVMAIVSAEMASSAWRCLPEPSRQPCG